MTRLRLRDIGGGGLGAAALSLLVLVLVGGPFLRLMAAGLSDGQGASLAPLAEALADERVLRALRRSLETALASAVLALGLGTLYALLLGLTNVRFKTAFVFLILAPMMIPPHVTAIAWIQSLGPSSVLLRTLGIAPPLGSTHPLYSPGGIVLLLAIQHAPLAMLLVRSGLRALPREALEAARIAGARPGRLFRRILAPMLAPHLAAAFMLAFVSGLGNFGIPALLGIPAGYTTLPVLIYERLSSFGPGVLGEVAVLSSVMAMVALLAALGQRRLERRARSQTVGPPSRPLAFDLGAGRPLAEAGLALAVLATLALPLASLVSTALVGAYGVTLTPQTATLANFEEVLFRQAATGRAFANSFLAAGGAALALGLFAVVFGHVARARGAGPLPALASGMADVAYALPGLVLSIALILVFVAPLPGIGVSLYGTVTVIFFAYLIRFLTVALKPVAAAYAQLDPSLDDAARVAGASLGLRLRRVFAPAVLPSAASGAILVFMTAYNEVTVSALLWSRGSETIGTAIFNYEDGGYTSLAAAMSTVTVAATGGLMIALTRLGRRLPAGAIPWRD
ncbi:MAG: ABC transporter permease [Albimonas sp.]|uniref:ABC transporter permease n=1 Tax=Albimonas sp. TaxID=1872425 RepID=UPI00405636DC